MIEKKIIIKSDITIKQSLDIRQVTRKAVAGLSEAELIERNSIGTYKEDDNDDGDEQTNKEKD